MHFCPEEMSAFIALIQNWSILGQFFTRAKQTLCATRRK